MKGLIIILVLLILSKSQLLQCEQQSMSKQKDGYNEQQMLNCLQYALRQGNMDLLKQITPLAKEVNRQLVIKKYEEEIIRLDMLQNDIILEQSTCEPILRWSQNTSHIFISLKTSHRWDSPPCLDSKSQSSYLNQSYFYYSNVCLVSHSKLHFELRMNLYGAVYANGTQGQHDEWFHFQLKNDGVGTQSVIIEKQEREIWPFLNKEETIYEIWIEIAERYPDATTKYQEALRQVIKTKKAKTPKNQLFVSGILLVLCLFFTL